MLFPQSIKTACRTFSGKHADSDLQKLSRTLETLLVLPDQTVYYIGIVSSVVPWILSYSHIPSYTSHRAVCWFNIMREEHMLSPQRAGRACWTFSGKHADNELPELSRTLETLLVLPEQTVYHIESLITVFLHWHTARYIPAASFGMKIDSVSIRISPIHSDRLWMHAKSVSDARTHS